MGHLGGLGWGMRLCPTSSHLLLVTFNPSYERLMLSSWALLLAKSLSSYFLLISEALTCCNHGPRPWSHTDLVLALPALFGSQDHCASVSLPQRHPPKPSPTQSTRMFFLMDSSDPLLFLLKKSPCSSLPAR